MSLKWEHKIYDNEFNSKSDFINEFNNIIEDLEERRKAVKKLSDQDISNWENNQSRDAYDDLLEEAIEKIDNTLREIKDLKGDLK